MINKIAEFPAAGLHTSLVLAVDAQRHIQSVHSILSITIFASTAGHNIQQYYTMIDHILQNS